MQCHQHLHEGWYLGILHTDLLLSTFDVWEHMNYWKKRLILHLSLYNTHFNYKLWILEYKIFYEKCCLEKAKVCIISTPVFVIGIFSLYIHKYFDFSATCSVYNMYIIHYSSNKNIGYVRRGIKANLRSKNSTALGPRPTPVLKFLDLLLYVVFYS